MQASIAMPDMETDRYIMHRLNTGSSEPNYMSENTEIECSDTHRCDIRRLLATTPHPPYPPPHRSKVYISGDTPSSASLTSYITVRTVLNV
jgi:hypothetical protein